MSALSTASGNANKNILSNTPIPPGTWLKTPVAWAITNRPIYVPNGMCTNGNRQQYSTNPAKTLSVAPKIICNNAVLVVGTWNLILPMLMCFLLKNNVAAKYANTAAAQIINRVLMPTLAPTDLSKISVGTRKYPAITMA